MNRRSAFLVVLALLAWCGAARADQSPPPSIAPFIPRTKSVRPVVAAGLHYIYSLDASFYEVIRRNEDGTPGAVVVPGSPLAAIFAPLIAQLNAKANYPAATGIKKCPASLAGAAYHPPGYGPMPFENAACIEEAYDSGRLLRSADGAHLDSGASAAEHPAMFQRPAGFLHHRRS